MFKKSPWLLVLVTGLALAASGSTTNYNLEKPADGDDNWGDGYRDNLDTIDTQMFVNSSAITNHIADTTAAHAASAISTDVGGALCITADDVQEFLECLDSNFNLVIGGAVVTLASTQTITGSKTFSSVIQANGGIKVNTPATSLGLSSVANVEGVTVASTQYPVFQGISVGSGNPTAFVGTAAGGTLAAPTAVVTSDQIMILQAAPFDGTNTLPTSLISFDASGTVASGSVPTDINFYGSTGSGSPTKGFKIGSTGKPYFPTLATAGILHNTVTTGEVTSSSIVNADVDVAAAIAYSKLNLASSIVTGDITNGTILNTDVSASAAIDYSKLASLATGHILAGNAGTPTDTTVSGDVTIGATGVTAIGTNKVTNAMLSQVSTATFKGRTTAATGNVEDLTATQATALLNNLVGDSGSGGTKGLVPAPSAGDTAAGKFLKADGTWVVPTGSGDVTGPGSSVDSEIALFSSTTGKILKRASGTGVVYTTSGVLSNEAQLTLAHGGTSKNATAVNGGLVWSDADSMEITAAGTSQNWVLSGGAGTPTMSNTTTTGKFVDGSADEIQMRVQGHSTQTSNILTVEKSDATVLLNVTNTAGTAIRGTTTNDTASAGFVAEPLLSSVVRSAALSLTSNTAKTITSRSFSAGDWEICGGAEFLMGASTSVTQTIAGVSLTTDTLPASTDIQMVPTANEIYVKTDMAATVPGNGVDLALSFPCYRASFSTTTTLYLVVRIVYISSGPAGYGFIQGRRLR